MDRRALLACIVAVIAAQQTVRLAIPSWAGEAHCQVGSKVLSVDSLNRLSIACPDNVGQLECSFGSAEPLDLSLATACRLGDLPVMRSSNLQIISDLRGDMTVQWLQDEGAGLRVLAQRTIHLDGAPVSLQVARSSERLIRVARSGASPVTLVPVLLAKSESWFLPPPHAGGELFLRVPAARVRPTAFRIIGSTSQLAKASDRGYSVVGLPEGGYQVTPEYSSALRGRTLRVSVKAGESTDLEVRPEPVGAVQIHLSERACAFGPEIAVSSLRVEGGQRVSRSILQFPSGQCDVLADGLQPGQFTVELIANGGVIASQNVVVGAQEVKQIDLSVDAFVVAGRVLLNDKPFQNATIMFEPVSTEGRTGSVGRAGVAGLTGSDGGYLVLLGAPGRYVVSLRDSRFGIVEHEKEIRVDGPKTFDWSVIGADLEVRLPNWNRTSAVRIDVWRQAAMSPVGGRVEPQQTYSVQPSDATPLRIRGLALGSYRIGARQEGQPTRVSSREDVTLDTGRPLRVVELTLAEHTVTLVVFDESGDATRGASVTGAQAKELEPGRFLFEGLPPATPLHVTAAGRVPVCRRSPDQGELRVTMMTGRSAVVHYFSDKPLLGPDGFFDLPGSDCLVNVFDFQFEPLQQSPKGASSFLFSNFPTAGFLVAPSDLGAGRVPLPPTGALSLKWQR